MNEWGWRRRGGCGRLRARTAGRRVDIADAGAGTGYGGESGGVGGIQR